MLSKKSKENKEEKKTENSKADKIDISFSQRIRLSSDAYISLIERDNRDDELMLESMKRSLKV